MPKKIELGEYLYLFPAPKNTSNCLIMAHGGYDKNCLPFPVPPGVTVHFYIPDRGTFRVSAGDFLEDLDLLHVEEKFGHTKDCQSTYCPDYILQKSINSGKENKHNDAFLNYKSLKREIADEYSRTTMNVISVRNRLQMRNPSVSLSYAIRKSLAANRTITDFHCGFCRKLIGDTEAKTYLVERKGNLKNGKMTALEDYGKDIVGSDVL